MQKPIPFHRTVVLVILTLLLTACQLLSAAVDVPAQAILTITPSATNPATLTPTTTPYLPSTDTPTVLPSPTGTPTPTPHPMEILAMRAGSYPGSEIVVEAELEPGANYRRYYAWYLSEGLRIYGLLTIPLGEPPSGGWPAILFNHGYIPPDVYRTTERYIAYVDRLATSGYVVFRIDYRGHDRSEGEATGAYGSPGYTVDVLNAIASLKQHPQVNPEKIGIWGHSMGGFLALRAMVISDDIKAGVIWAGVVASYPDMLTRWRRAQPGPTPTPRTSGPRRWRDEWVAAYGLPEENPDFWRSVSANAFLTDLSGPVQLHHGTADTDVPLEFSLILAQEIADAGKVVELYTYEGDNHNLSTYFSLAMNRTIEFYDRFLK